MNKEISILPDGFLYSEQKGRYSDEHLSPESGCGGAGGKSFYPVDCLSKEILDSCGNTIVKKTIVGKTPIYTFENIEYIASIFFKNLDADRIEAFNYSIRSLCGPNWDYDNKGIAIPNWEKIELKGSEKLNEYREKFFDIILSFIVYNLNKHCSGCVHRYWHSSDYNIKNIIEDWDKNKILNSINEILNNENLICSSRYLGLDETLTTYKTKSESLIYISVNVGGMGKDNELKINNETVFKSGLPNSDEGITKLWKDIGRLVLEKAKSQPER